MYLELMTYKAGQIINLFVESVDSQETRLNTHRNFEGEFQFILPFEEQSHRLSVGSEILCVLYKEAGRSELFASMKLEKHANKNITHLKENQKVSLYIIRETDLGFKCIIDAEHIGMLYKNEVFQDLHAGDKVDGFIKKLRDDNKIDLILRAPGHKATGDISEKILEQLKINNGFLAVTDKTAPEEIYRLFGASKKKFKIALGGLYKARIIQVSDDGIKLI